jgi:glucans biosynthesis protein
MNPRRLRRLLRLAALVAVTVLAVRSAARAEMFDFEVLRYKAKLLAAKPYQAPAGRVPEFLLKLSYDQYRDIRFIPSEARWRREQLPFQLQYFHPGFIFNQTVELNELNGQTTTPIRFSSKLFDYGHNHVPPPDSVVGFVGAHLFTPLGQLMENLELRSLSGFAGFRILYPLNKPGDELGAFQGASYLRFLCQRAVYGLSARGLAINTGQPGGEEFPRFEEFWIERPAPGATSLVLYALLDGPSASGAFRFVVTPGAETVLQVREALYFRRNPAVVGLAPLTSMFWHGENTNREHDDFRPEVHDSDGLMLNTGAGEWLWRPLTNPSSIREAAFGDDNPRGFGLLQRDRNFENYQDLEAGYHQRPSAWVEPVGAWGHGSVRLVELPTPDETNDNIVAFWVPAALPPPGEPLEVAYRLHWFLDQIHPPAGYVVATRHGRSKTHEPDLERFMVDFDGPYLGKQGPDPAIQPVVTVGAGAALVNATVQKNPFNGTWRVAFALRPDGSHHPVELRCFLSKPPHVLTETWTYLWQP